MKIRALIVEEKDALVVEQELDLEEPARDVVLVRIDASGVAYSHLRTL